MDSQNNDSKNTVKCETNSQIMMFSKTATNCDKIPLGNDDIDPNTSNPTMREFLNLERHQTTRFYLRTPTPNSDLEGMSEEGQIYQERIPPRVNSTPNLGSTTRTSSGSFHSAIGISLIQLTPESVIEKKHDDDNWNNQEGIDSKSLNHLARSYTLPATPGNFGIWRLMSRFTSLVRSRPLDFFDEEVLNNFNLEVCTAASRIDMWRQRLEDDRTNSVRSHSRSAWIGSSPHFAPSEQAQSFITGEIHNLIQLTRDLINSLFSSFGWGLLGIEDKIMVLLERGSHIVFPAAEILITNFLRMLRLILDSQKDNSEKRFGVYSVTEAINNAFSAIISLIQLGKAYRNAHESSDNKFITEDSRSLLAGSLANLDIEHPQDS